MLSITAGVGCSLLVQKALPLKGEALLHTRVAPPILLPCRCGSSATDNMGTLGTAPDGCGTGRCLPPLPKRGQEGQMAQRQACHSSSCNPNSLGLQPMLLQLQQLAREAAAGGP